MASLEDPEKMEPQMADLPGQKDEKDASESSSTTGTVIAGETNTDSQASEAKAAEKSETVLACLQVVGAFFLMFNSWGIVNTFGAYEVYYEGALLKNQTASNISWIGSIQAFLLLVTSERCICKEYWQVLLAQGVVVGCGTGCLLLPSIAVMPQYFKKRRAFATGIAASGSSIGGVLYPIIFHKIEPRVGFGWATRVIAFIMFATLLIPVLVMRAKVFPATTRPLVDWKVLRNVPWDLFSVGSFFGFIGMYIPFYYASTYGFEKGIVSENVAFYMLSILNASSIFGRIIPNFFADATGPLNITAPFILFCGVISFCWLSITSVGQLVVFCIFYGFFSGTFVSIVGPCLFTLSPDLSLVGTHMGMSFAFGAFGLVIGTPVAGALLDHYGWIGPAMFCGAANVLAAIFIAASRLSKTGLVLKAKA